MSQNTNKPSVILICHAGDRLDREGLASWLGSTLRLAGLIEIEDRPGRILQVAKREIRRSGWLAFLDVLAFRLFARLTQRASDESWTRDTVAALQRRFPADLAGVPRITVSNPNSAESIEFLEAVRPDVLIARCKFILKPEVFGIARVGAFALHPGICPEYRNAHGCFWALVNRDLDRVGMTMLKLDRGIDTGPVYLQASYPIDEANESHYVIQQRVVVENLEAIGDILTRLCAGEAVATVPTAGRKSATWGQPTLSAYLRWKRSASHQSLVTSH